MPPKWPSGLSYIDLNCGGFYGLTTVAAEKGTGKTTLMIASLLEAAATGEWQVIHAVAEDDEAGLRERLNLYLNANPGAEDAIGSYHPFFVGKGQSVASFAMDCVDLIEQDYDTPVVIGTDSINSIVNLSGRNYLRTLSDFSLWMMFSRRISNGAISFLVNSETNKRGESKGESLPSLSDVYLKLKKTKEKGIVEARLDKTRLTRGEGDIGKLIRRWDLQRFYAPEELEHMNQLHLVGSA